MDRKSNLDNTQFRYTPDAGTIKGPCYCGVCDAEMKLKSDCNGPRNFVEAMGGYKSAYDSFSCPHNEENWHKQIVQLRLLAIKTPSAKVEKMLLEEVDEIMKNRKPTKELRGDFSY